MSLFTQKDKSLSVHEICLFSLLGALMYLSKLLLEFLPNVHMIGMFIVVFTLRYRVKALFPIYVFVFLCGLFGGFNLWWVPYLYIWTVLWFTVMLLPKGLVEKKLGRTVYPIVSMLHGFLFGTLYAPAQAIMYGLNFKGMIAWIVAGLSFDFIHGIGNLCFGFLIIPLYSLLKKFDRLQN